MAESVVGGAGANGSMAPAPLVTVAVCQLGPVLGQVAVNLRKVEVAVRDAAEAGARVVVLPELVTTGYVFESVGQARGLAERLDGPSLRVITTDRKSTRLNSSHAHISHSV